MKINNNELVMPNNYAVVNEEEMTYVDGGWCIKRINGGYNIYLTHNERKKLTTGYIVAGAAVALPSAGIASVVLLAWRELVKEYDEGYGIRIKVGFIGKQAIVKGIYSLTKSQEKNTASKNKVIW